jgi:thiol-disulfide isomerase/thioredoxin
MVFAWMRLLTAAAAVTLVALAMLGILGHREPPRPLPANALPVGTPVAAFSLPDSAGASVRLPPPGTAVLIHYWASWCGPCLRELPVLREFARRRRDGPRVVAIALEGEATSRPWLAAHPQPFPVLLERPDAHDSANRLGNVRNVLPFTVLVGADGRILATRTGPFASVGDLEAFAAPAR